MVSNHLVKVNRASHVLRVRAKERVRSVRDHPRENPKVPKVFKVRTRVKPRKLAYQVWKSRNQRQAQKHSFRTHASHWQFLHGQLWVWWWLELRWLAWWLEFGWMAWGLGSNLWRLHKLIVTRKFWSWCHEQSEAVWLGENEPVHRSCSRTHVHWTSVQMEQEMEKSFEQPVTECILDDGAWQLSRLRWKRFVSIVWTEDPLVYTKKLCWRNRVHRTTSPFGSDVGFMIPVHSKIGHEMRIQFERLVSWIRKKTVQISQHRRQHHLQIFFLSKEVKSTEINIVNISQQPGNEYGRAVRS